jgi:hypothetical protein
MNASPFRVAVLVLAAILGGCRDAPLSPPPPIPDPGAPLPVGVYRLAISGLGTGQMTSSIVPAPPEDGDANRSLTTVLSASITFEQISAQAFVEGTRSGGGQRYTSFTYRVRNGTGAPLNNLTILLVGRAGTISGTALSSLKRFDGSAADPSIATKVVPTGAVALWSDQIRLESYPDVIQALTEAEVAAITPPAGVTNIFPVGYVVRHRTSTSTRTLPAAASNDQFDGLLTLSFRLPLQSSPSLDVHSFFFEIMAVTDTEPRMTESIEEGQDTAAVRRLRERAASLGATTVTVLNGSTVISAGIPDYPGQRQICNARTAGTAASPVTNIVSPAGYAGLMLLTAGESVSSCGAYFRTGTPSRPATNVPFTVTLKAVDRYGNVLTGQADSVHLEQAGVAATYGPAALLASGSATQQVTYPAYGSGILEGVGHRLRGQIPILVAGVSRTWTAGASTTDWHTNGNWSPAAVPMAFDSVIIPSAMPFYPVIASSVTIQGVDMASGATLMLNGFNLTANADVATADTTAGVSSTTGTLVLGGAANTVRGRLPRVLVTGSYTMSGNLKAVAPQYTDAGMLLNPGHIIRIDAQ